MFLVCTSDGKPISNHANYASACFAVFVLVAIDNDECADYYVVDPTGKRTPHDIARMVAHS